MLVQKRTQAFAKRYAKALLSVAIEQDCLDRIKSELDHFLQLIDGNVLFVKVLKNPTVSKDSMEQIVIKISNKLKFCKVTRNFLLLLIRRKRLVSIKEIVSSFREYELSKVLNKEKVHVVTARPITSKQEEEIKHVLEKKINKKVFIQSEINPDILGGIIIYVKSYMIDFSINGKLNKLKKVLEGIS